MKAAVIGANGYIGRHLCFYLLEKGWEVQGYGRKDETDIPLQSYKKLDVSRKDDFRDFNTDVDFVFYFSGLTGTYKSFDEYGSYVDVNETGLLHLLDRLRSAGAAPRVVFPSTRLVYKGQENTPLNEEAEKEFKTIYALTKWFGEQVLQQYATFFGIPYSVFRICVPYGNLFTDQYSYGTIGFFLGKARSGQDITLFGNGELKRTFTHAEDICQQIYFGILNESSVNGTFNIGGETYSLKEAASLIAAKFGVKIAFSQWPETDAKLESGDTIFDAGRLQKMNGIPYKHRLSDWVKSAQ